MIFKENTTWLGCIKKIQQSIFLFALVLKESDNLGDFEHVLFLTHEDIQTH